MFGVVSLTMGNSALPFAYGLVRHMQRLRQRRLRHALLLSPFGDKSAEKLFVQSDHLAAIVPDRRENATDCRFTCIAMARPVCGWASAAHAAGRAGILCKVYSLPWRAAP